MQNHDLSSRQNAPQSATKGRGARNQPKPASLASDIGTITISRKTARLIDQAFLPLNPNKLRGKPNSTLVALRAACSEFKTALKRADDRP